MASKNTSVAADLKGGKVNFDYLKKNNMDIADLVKMARKGKEAAADDESDESYYEEIIEEEVIEDDMVLWKRTANMPSNFQIPQFQAKKSASPPKPPKKKKKKKKEIDGSKLLLLQSAEQKLTDASKKFREALQEGAAIVSLLEFMLADVDWDDDEIEEVDGDTWETRSTFVSTSAEAKSIIDRLESAKHELMGTRNKQTAPPPAPAPSKPAPPPAPSKPAPAPAPVTRAASAPSTIKQQQKPATRPLLGSHREPSFRAPDLATLDEEETEHQSTASSSSASAGSGGPPPPPPPPASTKKNNDLEKAKSEMLKFAQEGKKLANKLTSPLKTTSSASDEMAKAKASMMAFAKEGAALADNLLESRSDHRPMTKKTTPQQAAVAASNVEVMLHEPKKEEKEEPKVEEAKIPPPPPPPEEPAKAEESKDKSQQPVETKDASAISGETPQLPLSPRDIQKKEMNEAKKMFLDAATQGASLVTALETKIVEQEAAETEKQADPNDNTGNKDAAENDNNNTEHVGQAEVAQARDSFMRLAQQGVDLVNQLEKKISTPVAATDAEQTAIDASERDEAIKKELTKAGDFFLETAKEGAQLVQKLETKLEETAHGKETSDTTDSAGHDLELANKRTSFLAAAEEGAKLVAQLEDKISHATVEAGQTTTEQSEETTAKPENDEAKAAAEDASSPPDAVASTEQSTESPAKPESESEAATTTTEQAAETAAKPENESATENGATAPPDEVSSKAADEINSAETLSAEPTAAPSQENETKPSEPTAGEEAEVATTEKPTAPPTDQDGASSSEQTGAADGSTELDNKEASGENDEAKADPNGETPVETKDKTEAGTGEAAKSEEADKTGDAEEKATPSEEGVAGEKNQEESLPSKDTAEEGKDNGSEEPGAQDSVEKEAELSPEEQKRKAEEARERLARERLLAFYRRFNPNLAPKVDKIMETYKGRIDELNDKMKKKYGEGFMPESQSQDKNKAESKDDSKGDAEGGGDDKRGSVKVSSADILALRANATDSFDSAFDSVEGDDAGKTQPTTSEPTADSTSGAASEANTGTPEGVAGGDGEDGKHPENGDTVQQPAAEKSAEAAISAKDDLDKAKQSFLAAAQEGASMISQLEKKLETDQEPKEDGTKVNTEAEGEMENNGVKEEGLMTKARQSFLAAAKEGAALVAMLEDQGQKDKPTKEETDVLHTSKSFMDAAFLVDKLDKSAKRSSVVSVKEVAEEVELVEEEVVEDEVEAAKKALLQFAKEGASLVSKLESKFSADEKAEEDEEIIEEVVESDDERADFLQSAKADFLAFSKGLDKKL
ncbi:expressed unknown protein [Seminavis robusta]|uniref:Uncharacterized protein n=1 Tax=Seminavis robusta TaxID=568900 RepID=A0A9N8DRD8_9STRA|nr:expressed unknown protein [Seminavis robusta]|eukprot:Sro234_g094480.1 n/a (1311) ;mRNA; f:52496-56428